MQTDAAIRNATSRHGQVAAQDTNDALLLKRIAQGDKAAMHTLYARHNLRTYRFILRIVGNASTAEDLVSHVFLDVWRTAAQFASGSEQGAAAHAAMAWASALRLIENDRPDYRS